MAVFACGAAPLIWFNARWPMPTLAAASEQGGPAGGFAVQLLERLGVLEHLLDGEHLARGATALSPTPGMMAILVGIGAIAVAMHAIVCPRERRRAPLFALIACALILVAAAATPGGFAGHHVILTYPFPHLIAASAVIGGARWLVHRSVLGSGAILAIGLMALAQNWVIADNHLLALEATGGTNNFSDAIYDAARSLELEGDGAPVVSLDWGLHMPLVGLSQGRIHSVEMLDGSPEQFKQFFEDPGTRYVTHAPDAVNNPVGQTAFANAAKLYGQEPALQQEFVTRDGTPVIDVYVVRPATAEARP
jgi:hypothetical protein